MTQPKSRDRIELDLFLELRAEDGPVTSVIVALKNKSREKVLETRAPRAHQALTLARTTLQSLRAGRVAELLPQTAVACLGLLEALDCSAEESLSVVGPEEVTWLARLSTRHEGALVGFGFAYGFGGGVAGGGVAGCGGGGGSADGKGGGTNSTGVGYGGMAGGGVLMGGTCGLSTGGRATGGTCGLPTGRQTEIAGDEQAVGP